MKRNREVNNHSDALNMMTIRRVLGAKKPRSSQRGMEPGE